MISRSISSPYSRTERNGYICSCYLQVWMPCTCPVLSLRRQHRWFGLFAYFVTYRRDCAQHGFFETLNSVMHAMIACPHQFANNSCKYHLSSPFESKAMICFAISCWKHSPRVRTGCSHTQTCEACLQCSRAVYCEVAAFHFAAHIVVRTINALSSAERCIVQLKGGFNPAHQCHTSAAARCQNGCALLRCAARCPELVHQAC